MKKVINTRNMQTGIHELCVVLHKPKTVLKAFRILEEMEDKKSRQIIENNTKFLGEINFRKIDYARMEIIFEEEKYKIINKMSFDTYYKL